MTLEDLVQQLKTCPGIAQWQVLESRAHRGERYLTFLEAECERSVETCSWEVWLALPQRDGKHGEARFELDAAADAPVLADRLEEALAHAAATRLPAWHLPGPGSDGVARTAVDVLAAEVSPWLSVDRACGEFVQACAAVPWVEAASCEMAFTHTARHLVNHHGLDLSDQQQRLEAEYVLLHRDAAGIERELYGAAEAVDAHALELVRRVTEAARDLREGADPVPPPTGPRAVLLPECYFTELLGYYVHHTDAATHVRGLNRLEPGEAVAVDPGAEAFDLHSDPRVSSTAAYGFDPNGYAPTRQTLIAAGRVQQLHGSAQWMQVLGRSPRGTAGTLVVKPGRQGVDQLRSEGVLEIVRFSEFGPRLDTGAFAGEIRLGWLHGPDGERRAVRGGSLTGSVAAAMAGVAFSRESVAAGNYKGPRFALLGRADIAV
ncbi:MAG: metallopeptidase TldD-related protein [Planctomycetota bacterium]